MRTAKVPIRADLGLRCLHMRQRYLFHVALLKSFTMYMEKQSWLVHYRLYIYITMEVDSFLFFVFCFYFMFLFFFFVFCFVICKQSLYCMYWSCAHISKYIGCLLAKKMAFFSYEYLKNKASSSICKKHMCSSLHTVPLKASRFVFL